MSYMSKKTRRSRQALSALVSCTMVFSLVGAPAIAYGDVNDGVEATIALAEESGQPTNDAAHVADEGAAEQKAAPEPSAEDVAAPTTDDNASEEAPSSENAGETSAEDDVAARATGENPSATVTAEAQPQDSAATEASEIAAGALAATPSYADVLAGCSVVLNRTVPFTADDDEVAVSVRLHDSVPQCYLTLFAYAGNTAFDPDATQNIRLWEGRVQNGDELTCSFNASRLPLKPGYKVIACLNVPLSEDYYRPVNSAPIDVVDEQGETFVDYVYPDATIDEAELEAGATSLHVNLSGDERLFEAARAGQTTLTVSVAQYPADDDFDFESADQVQLCSPITATEAFNGREVKLNEPLRPGYRARAVVYWAQNPAIFLPKGNDYEVMFHRPDDSVLVSESREPAATIEGAPAVGDTELTVRLSGDIPSGSVLLVKSYDADATPSLGTGDILASSISVDSSGTVTVALDNALTGNTQVVAYVLNGGLRAQSASVSVVTPQPYQVELADSLTSASTKVVLKVTPLEEALVGKTINAVRVTPVSSDGTVDTSLSGAVASVYGKVPGTIEIDLAGKKLAEGSRVCIYLLYDDASKTFLSDPITVSAPMADNDLVLVGDAVAADVEELVVNVNGYEEMKDGRLIVTTGTASTIDDADSRTQVASVTYTGPGTYRMPIPAGRLFAGQMVQVHLYKYDFDNDATLYRYGNALPVVRNAVAVEPQVSVVTQGVTDDRSDVWAQVNFDPALTGTVALYCHEGSLWTVADLIWTAPVQPQEYSQRLSFGAGKLIGGRNLTAVLTLSDGTTAVSDSVSVQKAPEPERPIARIKDAKVTAGMTTLHAALTFDSNVSEATYTLYRLTADGARGEAITSGTLYASVADRSLYLGTGKIAAGDRMQLVLTAGGMMAESNIVEVLPSPEWGGAYVVFNESAATPAAREIPVTVNYTDEYLTMEDFYCDISVYEVSPFYSDEQIEEMEIWENTTLCRRVGQLNSTLGDVTCGAVSVPVREGVELAPGMRLFVKVRLPHVEWAGEEVDYVSASIPVLEEGEELPPTKVLLYNLGTDTARGSQVRAMLADLGVAVETVSASDLSQEIGYLAGLTGFEKSGEEFSGTAPSTEFMLMCGMGEALLDQFLDRMQADGLRINHKAIVTEYNRYYTLAELIGDIEEEHEVFQALLALDRALAAASALSAEEFGAHNLWEALQKAIDHGNAVLGSEEPALSDLQAATERLNDLVATLTGNEEPTEPGTPDPTPAPGGDPDPDPNPGTHPAEPGTDPTPGGDNSGNALAPGGDSGSAPTRPGSNPSAPSAGSRPATDSGSGNFTAGDRTAGGAGADSSASNGATASRASRGSDASDRAAARSSRADGQNRDSLEGRTTALATATDTDRAGRSASAMTSSDTSGASFASKETPLEVAAAAEVEEGETVADEATPLTEGAEEQSVVSQAPLWAAIALIAVVAAACGLVLGWRRRADR